MTSSSHYPTSINVGVMDILNFLDKKDLEHHASYDMMKENENGYQDRHMDGLDRRESRIPVAVRRLRPRSDRTNTVVCNEGNQHRSNDANVEDWQTSWNNSLCVDKQVEEPKSKLPRIERKKTSSMMVNQLAGMANNGPVRTGNMLTTNGQQHVLCPKCGRSCIMINKDGVYVAFTVGVTPLVLLCLFLICLFFGWLGLGHGVGPEVLRRLRSPNAERERSKTWFNWFPKQGR